MGQPSIGSRQDQATTLDHDLQAVELRRNGANYDQIAQRLGISKTTAWEAVQRALHRALTEAVPDVRKLELDRLDALQLAALTVLRRQHVIVQAGKIVYDEQGQPLVDDGPTLAAIKTLIQIQERRARLLGLDAPTKVDLKVLTLDQMTDRIAELEQLLAADAG